MTTPQTEHESLHEEAPFGDWNWHVNVSVEKRQEIMDYVEKLKAQLAAAQEQAESAADRAERDHHLMHEAQVLQDKAEADAAAMRAIIESELVASYRAQSDPYSEENSGAFPEVRKQLVQEAKNWLARWDSTTAGRDLLTRLATAEKALEEISDSQYVGGWSNSYELEVHEIADEALAAIRGEEKQS